MCCHSRTAGHFQATCREPPVASLRCLHGSRAGRIAKTDNFMIPKTHEKWKRIAGFSRYECSSLGRFRNRITGNFLNGAVNWTGYVHVGLIGKSGKQVFMQAHRIIAKTFLGKCSGKHDAMHLDGVKTNNAIANLRWMTRSQNAKFAANRNRPWRISKRKKSRNHLAGVLHAINRLLTTRQREFAHLWLKGFSYRDIAGRMRISDGRAREISKAVALKMKRATAQTTKKGRTWNHRRVAG